MNKHCLYIFIILGFSCIFTEEPTIPASPWELAQPSEVGLDQESLLESDQRIQDDIYGNITSLIIIKDDKLVFENYYRGTDRNTPIDLEYSTISISSIAAGIFLEEQIGSKIETPISELLSNKTPFKDPLRAKITFEHLLSMRTGILWDEVFSAPNANSVYQMSNQADWAAFVLNQPMDSQPDGRFVFNAGATMVFSKIVQENTGQSLSTFANEKIFKPLGIEYTWEEDPSGTTIAFRGLRMTPRSMAKLGYLALKGGTYFGNRIVSSDYIKQMSSLQSQIDIDGDYGYGWWKFSEFVNFVSNLDERDVFYSQGQDGGQYIFVVPNHNMVVVTTATNFPPDFFYGFGISLFLDEVLYAIVGQ